MEMINKLKNTRQMMVKANQEYMAALDNAYQFQEMRIASLKQKLRTHRSRYINNDKSKYFS